MESMGILGFIFGMSGLSIALIGKEQIASLKKEFDALKEELEKSGVTKQK